MTTASREHHLVELVDEHGAAIGAATVEDAHRAPGRLHRAFSVFLLDKAGRILLQQRAATKTRFPLRWANTCCGHPQPGKDLTRAAGRRLVEEIGVGPVPLREVGVYSYYAEDPSTGRVEYEYDHVLVGTLPPTSRLQPDPLEVAQLRWVHAAELRDALRLDSHTYAPWLTGVASHLLAHLSPDDAPERSGGR